MERIKEFDVLKGLLIVLVVIGHCIEEDSKLHQVIFWFHMPAFFMISGYFINETANIQAFIKNKTRRLVIPYLSWCTIFYLIFKPESIIKNLVRVVYGGTINTTAYSYPFWFVNALFCSYILFLLLLKIKSKYRKYYLFGIVAFCYISIHMNKITLPYSAPWALDIAIGSLPYIYIGYLFKRYRYIVSHRLFVIIPIFFLIYQYIHCFNYSLNMKGMHYESYILDLVVPCSFTFAAYLICKEVAKMKFVGKIAAKLGEASMTIMFSHAAIILILARLPEYTQALSTICIGYLIDKILKTNKITSLLLLGENTSAQNKLTKET